MYISTINPTQQCKPLQGHYSYWANSNRVYLSFILGLSNTTVSCNSSVYLLVLSVL